MIPGRALHRLAARICCAKTLERIVEPAIADLQKEYRSAGAGQLARRALVLLAGYVAILKVIAICAFSITTARDDERRLLANVLTWSLAMVFAVAALLILPPLFGRDPGFRGWYAATTVVPQAVPLAIPIGVAFGLALGLSARPTANTVKVMLLGALAASVLSFAILAWVIPAAGQVFREITFRELEARGYSGSITDFQKGYSEMTLSELRSQAARFSADGEPRIARRYAFSVHRRFGLAAATLALVSVLLAAPVGHRGLRGVTAFAACLVYWMLMFAGDLGSRRDYLTPPLAAWLPNVVLIASAIAVVSSRSSWLRGSEHVT